MSMSNLDPKILKIAKGIGIAILIVVAIEMQPFTYEKIDAGNVGIKINMIGTDKGVSDVTSVTGIVWYNSWITKIIEFPTYTQSADYAPFVITTKDAAEFKVDPKLNYSISETTAPKIYRRYRIPLKEIESGFLKNTIYNAYRIAANSYTSDSVMSNRESFEAKVELVLTQQMLAGGFIFEQLTSALTPPPALRDMIDAKNQSIQARLTADNQALQAESEAKVAVAKAKGLADALMIQAKSEADANKLRQSSLTPMLIQQQWIEAWDGKLSTTSFGSNQPVIFNMK